MKKYTIKVGEVFTQKKANELIEYLKMRDKDFKSARKKYGGNNKRI